MSSIIVPLATIDKVSPHPDPETTNLELVQVLGWQLVAQKEQYREGDIVVYVPPNSVLPLELSEKLNVTKYLSKQRVRGIRLRGEPSFGFAFTPEQEVFDWEVGTNVAEHYGITKFEPPPQMLGDDGEPEHPLFKRYTDIENLRTFPDVFADGEPIVVTEKLDGTNCRILFSDRQICCGSFRVQRKAPVEGQKKQSLYWWPVLHMPEITHILEHLGSQHRQVILFGEIYGPGVRSLTYGVTQGTVEFRIFDIYCDGRFLDWDEFSWLCQKYGVPMAPPIVYHVPYSLELIKKLSTGRTTISGIDPSHIREGVVVRPMQERRHPRVGRVVMKYVNADYLIKQSAGAVVDYTEV